MTHLLREGIIVSSKTRGGVGVILAALLGAILAEQVFIRHAQAYCASPSWRVELLSVTASDGSTAHEAYWPTQGVLTAYEGRQSRSGSAEISFSFAPAGSIERVRGGQ